ncbi:MAG: hypothetical protein MRZ79_16990 [Bacteroidia bacterium]|nr:hypothetical protein [Bacteroidia bacterium]
MASPYVLGTTPLQQENKPIEGEYKVLDGQKFYKISNYDSMRPFFISLVSHTDHWLFISSTGGLSAGRKNQKHTLFPYYTDDKLTDSAEFTGSKTILKVNREGKTYIWEPFSQAYQHLYPISRNLYKNDAGNILIFEETNHELNLSFQYSWKFSAKYGFVKHSQLSNLSDSATTVKFLDGLQNILPYGISNMLQDVRSNLSHAYKKCELEKDSGLGLFMLSAMIVDKAEPSEALKATTVWSAGIEASNYLLSSRQVSNFRLGREIETEVDMRAEPGSYFIESSVELSAKGSSDWFMVAEINQDHSAVIQLISLLENDKADLIADLNSDVALGTEALKKLVGMADGLQMTGYSLSVGRHYSNVLFNIMRGGIFEEQYSLEKSDLLDYVKTICPKAMDEQISFFEDLPEDIHYMDLINRAKASNNSDLVRISYEYLPISFSRRHGDPSRPWNKFSIETTKEDGSKSRYYQGNWRDIFQNWEALAISFPGYINSMITKFVNASTIDGYNPYRITRNGIDWEVIEPDDPWSFIGYWGDHQIIYLLKLLEVSNAHDPNALNELLLTDHFVYSNVPYRIKSYKDILLDPQDTIDFDESESEIIDQRCSEAGGDGKLVYDEDGQMVRATLTEKLLLTLLTKLYNFVPETGIWLNTQRPEWNDANNALVGNGVSMVTLCYIRRYINFCQELFGKLDVESFRLNEPVVKLFRGIATCFEAHIEKTTTGFSDGERKQMLDELGLLGEVYRILGYKGFIGMHDNLSKQELMDFFVNAQKYVDSAINLNRREDGLFHSYNLITCTDTEVQVSYLYEMLEGQVAVLSSGLLDAQQSMDVLDALKASPIYREDQYSYLLYPNRNLPRFLAKNLIPENFVASSKLAQTLLSEGNQTLLNKDVKGNFHFAGDFHNANDLKEALEKLSNEGYGELVEQEKEAYLEVFEDMFNHKAFTGRSGTFFGYEGLGSIYWHMVSKLLLATQEILYAYPDMDNELRDRLVDRYYEIRAGIGINKNPSLYGAFPTDPYSHTPAHKGAQQPGMTGQVKEDILNRWAELGLRVSNGELSFTPQFMHPDEFLKEAASFNLFDQEGQAQTIELQAGEMGFTYCQVPVIYCKSEANRIHLQTQSGDITMEGQHLGKEHSKHLFDRTGHIKLIRVELAL